MALENQERLDKIMAILNLPTFTEQAEKTPEEKLLESLQQVQVQRPTAEVPRFTRYGNRMAERGGFDVLPQEQLRGMTQQQVDEYEAERRKARGAGISETLMRVGQAFAGRDADAGIVRRQQARQAQAQQAEQERLMQQLAQDPRYADMIKLYRAGLDPSAFTPKVTKGPTSWEEYLRASKDPEYRKYLEEQEEAGATKIDFADKGFAALGPKKYEERLNLATSAQASNVNLDNLENIINQGLQTGFGAELGLTLNRIGQAIVGPTYEAGKIAGAESFAAGANQVILPLVKDLGVNPTDKDLDFVVKGSPELSKSVEGNKLMLKALKLANARKIDAHNFDNAFYTNPVNAGKTEIDRNVAFQIHMANNPQIYSSQPLVEEYNNLLEKEALQKLQSGEIISVDQDELPEGF